jgi:hypothetical protein
MIELNQKQWKKVKETISIAGRYDELCKLEGYVPSAVIARRKGILRKQLEKLTGKAEKTETEEQVVNIKINIPDTKVEKKEKSKKFTLKSLLSSSTNNDDDEILASIDRILPGDERTIIGKIVNEL